MKTEIEEVLVIKYREGLSTDLQKLFETELKEIEKEIMAKQIELVQSRLALRIDVVSIKNIQEVFSKHYKL